MVNEPTVVSDLHLTGPGRTGHHGTWWTATTATGQHRGALLLDQSHGSGAALTPLAARIAAVRGLALPGVLPVVDLVTDAGRSWMVTEEPASPTVAELLAYDSGRDADDAIAVALWTGQTLLALHTAGLTHGGLGPLTVVLTRTGTAALIEVGMAVAHPAFDVRAWSALLRTLAGRWGEEDGGLSRAALVAERFGIVAALEDLHARPTPGDLHPRPAAGDLYRLPVAADVHSAADQVTVPLSSMDQVTIPRQSAGLDLQTQMATATAPAAMFADTTHASPAPPAPPVPEAESGIRLRFGDGVPAVVEDIWREGRAPRPVRNGRRRGGIIGGLVTIALVAGVVGYLWWYNSHPLRLTGARVTADTAGSACDVTVDVVGTVATNGRPGTITYQWRRNDGETSRELTQSVPAGERYVPVHLYWRFSGKGSYDAEATLVVLGPDPVRATGKFTYLCR